ncbi:MAG: SMP-30/gluconolactonase/LRE family protein [Sphingobacteriales bacterium]|nr:MAG: SMP-30/gluconolactonase/LRE family protein [Sphingobacteriales bacterium]
MDRCQRITIRAKMKIETLYPSQCTLGESPVWHKRRGSYFWVDIEDGVLYELNAAKTLQTWKLNTRVSLIIEQEDDTLLLAIQGGVVRFNPSDGSMTNLVDLDKDQPQNRCNDGACDADGRLFVSTMDVHCEKDAGNLYRIDKDLIVTKVINDLTIPNGIVWSHDHARMYFIETMSRSVKSYIFNRQTGEIFYENVVVSIPEEMGYPDGMAIDAAGMLWIALYGGHGVSRWNPETGMLLEKITLPAPHITNCTFGGDNLDELIVTSAREELTEEQLAQYPESGSVFIITGLGVKGVENNRSNHI